MIDQCQLAAQEFQKGRRYITNQRGTCFAAGRTNEDIRLQARVKAPEQGLYQSTPSPGNGHRSYSIGQNEQPSSPLRLLGQGPKRLLQHAHAWVVSPPSNDWWLQGT